MFQTSALGRGGSRSSEKTCGIVVIEEKRFMNLNLRVR